MDYRFLAIVERLWEKIKEVESNKGLDGKDGAPGPKGQKGDTGPQGADGKDGKDGDSGDDGAPGKDGKDGEDGVSVVDADVDFDNRLRITLSDGREIDAGEINAPQGRGGDTYIGQTTSKGSSFGFADYNDAATAITPISVPADTFTPITNDTLGPFTNTEYLPHGITSLFLNDKVDPRQLSIGDDILIRYDFTITPDINGSFAEFRLTLGAGAGAYTLNRPIGTLSYGGGYSYQITGEFYVYMGDENTRDNFIGLEVKCSEPASVVNAGLVIKASLR